MPDQDLPADIARRFGVRPVRFLTATQIARLWIVTRGSGGLAVLKLYDGQGMRNEAAGFDYLKLLQGQSAARVFAVHGHAALIEYLDGASLGDMVRSGRDDEAARALLHVAATLRHAARGAADAEFPRLEAWFDALFKLRFAAGCAPGFQSAMTTATRIAQDLIGSQREAGLLHGDLHHDNVLGSPRGYCAFDAKGVVGERAFELANAFRNPRGAADLQRDPARIRRCLALWSQGLDVDPARLMDWAVAKCALSIAWRSGGVLRDDSEVDLLQVLLQTRADPAL